ncbi:MAG: DUF554 domain-containing protein [Anaerolineales bacterium]|nr:DUF554 domain-containing protein [Chloroflexota bacterium]MBL6982810.1 DUF554 domain-containing protein [Anaerolineales bacterium]
MTGTFLNVATVLIGGALGLIFSSRLPERVRKTVVAGLGLFTAAIGVQMFLETQNPIIVLGSILVGGILGEWWRIEDGLSNLGGFLERRFTGSKTDHLEASAAQSDSDSRERFIRGFLTASLVFCVGPMTILGSIQDGLTGDFRLLAIKSVLDGFASLAFASSLGVGVLFSSLTVLIFQGGISLLAAQAQALITPDMMSEMTAAGGLLLLGLSISSLLELKPIRVGNFLPALVLAPLIVGFLSTLGIY